jgi:hypothetical protein
MFDFAPEDMPMNQETAVTAADGENPNFIYSSEEDVEEIIEAKVEKAKPTNDIFEDIPSQIVADLESKINNAKPTRKTKKPVDPNKPKRKVNEEHMRKMREKAAETRARKKREKEEAQKLDSETKELTNRKKKLELEKMRKELDGDVDSEGAEQPKPAPAPAPAPVAKSEPAKPTHLFTQEDLARAQFEAIARYEVLRKDRKAKKRETQKIEAEKAALMQTLTGNRNQPRTFKNIYENCY